MQIGGLYSSIINTEGIIGGLVTSPSYPSAKVKFGRDTAGSESAYDKVWNYPSYGLAFMWQGCSNMTFVPGSRIQDFFNLYGWFDLYLLRSGRNSLYTSFWGGFGYTKALYDPLRNPANIYMSTPVLFFFDLGMYYSRNIGNDFHFLQIPARAVNPWNCRVG